MDKMNIKITGGVLSIAKLLITCRAKPTRFPINPASISIAMGWFFQLVFKGIISLLTNLAGFSSNSNWNTMALSQPAGDAIISANPVRVSLTGNNITGNGLNNNFPFSINIGACISINSPQPDVISHLSDIGYFRHRFT